MVDILAIGAHPDDVEFGCGGVLAKAAASGHSILIVDLTHGEKATNGTPEIRRQEGQAAAKVIGAERLVLDFIDCEIFDNYPNRLKLVALFRRYRPRLILAPMWKGEQNHPDHIACGIIARHACRYARFTKILPELPIWNPEGILHYLPHAGVAAEILIDVSDHMTAWKNMMAAHPSQYKTYPYSDWAVREAAHLGDLIGKKYAQGLIAGNPIEIDDVMTVSRTSREL